MKPIARISWLALGLSLAGLMAGCVSSDYRTARRIEPASDFEVVESSARRPLTAKEMAELRRAVAHYLDQQDQTDSGDYYLKVYLTPEVEGVTPEWAVVRFTRYTDTRIAVASAYPAYDYPYSSSYYSYDLYPYGYDGFGRISFQYYDDPFYGHRYYYPRRSHDRDHDHNHHDHKPGDRHSGGQPPPGGVAHNPPPRHDYPHHRGPDRIGPPNSPHPETAGRSRWQDNNGAQPRPGTSAAPARPAEPARQWRGRSENNGNAAGASRPASYRQAEARNDTRASTPSYTPRAESRSSSSSSSGSDRREVRHDGGRKAEVP